MISKKMKVILVIIVLLIGALVGVYFFGRNYYASHFFPGTYINGVDESGKTVEEAKADIQEVITNYDLVVSERNDQEEEITGEALGLKYVDDGGVEELMEKQGSDLWIVHITQNKSYETNAGYEYDESVIDSIMDDMKCFQKDNIIQPENAYINDTETGFEIVPEVDGTELNKKKVRKALLAAIDSTEESVDLDAEGCYKDPEIRSDNEELNAELTSLNGLISANIVYDMVDRQFTVDSATIKGWIQKGEDGTYSLNRDQVAAWVTDMAHQTDTFGLEHEFTTSTGETITLAGGGDYGWCIDQEATTEQLYNKIQEGANESLEPEYLFRANDRSTNDIGGTYAEICITSQTMWVYKDGQLVVQTPVITGCHDKGFDTPSGSCWAIDGKKPDMHFTIFNTITVKYWLPFNGDCGIHDATWNSDEAYANPQTYLASGSHGCINTPMDACAQAFDALEIGDPVIVYYSVDQVVGPEPTQEVTAG